MKAQAAAVVLAAGASRRLGEPKQLVTLAGERLLDRAVRLAAEAGCSPVVAVLGAGAERVRAECLLAGAMVVFNPGWAEGMASSIRAGLGAAGDAPGVLLMTCDQPAVTAQHLRALLASGNLTASAYGGRRGVPAYFPAASFPELLGLAGDAGARELLAGAAVVELAGGELDVDSAEELAEARRRFERDTPRGV